jgi:hypothetical protein
VSLFGDQKAASGPLTAECTEVTFANIGGLDAVKQQIRRQIITPVEKPSLFQAFRKRAGGSCTDHPAAARPCWAGNRGQVSRHSRHRSRDDCLGTQISASAKVMANRVTRAGDRFPRSHR